MISLILVLLLSPISCLLLWMRMIVTVDSFMHACVLSSMLYILFSIPSYLSMSITALCFVGQFYFLRRHVERNEALQIISVAFMSLTSLVVPKDMTRILFGNITKISDISILFLTGVCFIIYIFIYFFYKRIVLISLNSTLDRNKYGDNTYLRFVIVFIICLALGSVIEYVGTLFIMPMTIIPGIISREYVSSPLKMLILTLCINVLVVFASELIIYYYVLPINRVIVLTNFSLLLLTMLKKEIVYIK